MFWKLTALSATSPVDEVLDKENFTLEELLDEEEIIQECKALNNRLINFLLDRVQVEQLLRYIVEVPPENADHKRFFKFPFIACEIITCEIDVILKTLVEEVELMDLLFSFLEPNRDHSALLAGYFSKVVVCLMSRKTVSLMNYVQAHQNVFSQLVDLIGVTSIMEVLVRLVGADDHMYPNFTDVMQWLADSNLLDMVVDKLSPSSPPQVHANAAEVLCTITRNAPSALVTKMSSSSFIARIFSHALEDSDSKSSLVHSLSVCISLLDLKRSNTSPFLHSFRGQHMFETPIPVNPETVSAMLPKIGDLLKLLTVASDEKILPTTYGELRPPLGKHRLKIIEFIAVLLRTGNEIAEKELVSSGAIQRIVDLFFEYPFNNALHHHAERIIVSCLENKSDAILDHILLSCDLVERFLQADKYPVLSTDPKKPKLNSLPAVGKQAPKGGNLGHILRICNKLVQLSNTNSHIQTCLQLNSEWDKWQSTVLHERNAVENVFRWACGRPTALQVGERDSDDDDLNDRDYDIEALSNHFSHALRNNMDDNEDAGEDTGALDRDDDEDVYFDYESTEVVTSSIKLGDESLFTNSNWFAFDNGISSSSNAHVSTSASNMDEISRNRNLNDNENSSSDDELVEDGFTPDWSEWVDSTQLQITGSSVNPFEESENVELDAAPSTQSVLVPNGSAGPTLFEEDVEFVGMEDPLKRRGNLVQQVAENDDSNNNSEFNDTNYWKVGQEDVAADLK